MMTAGNSSKTRELPSLFHLFGLSPKTILIDMINPLQRIILMATTVIYLAKLSQLPQPGGANRPSARYGQVGGTINPKAIWMAADYRAAARVLSTALGISARMFLWTSMRRYAQGARPRMDLGHGVAGRRKEAPTPGQGRWNTARRALLLFNHSALPGLEEPRRPASLARIIHDTSAGPRRLRCWSRPESLPSTYDAVPPERSG